MAVADSAFTGSIPALYDRLLGPLLFEPFADEVGRRVAALHPERILETAAGTGIVTEVLVQEVPNAEIVATDLNPAMLDVATQRIRSDRVRYRPADAQDLPFGDGEFDLVVCQFGVMFFPDKVKGNSEARRVLRDGGRYMAIIWDRLDRNPVSRTISDAIAAEFPENPPQFLARTPFGYADHDRIEDDMLAAGFNEVHIEVFPASSPVSAADAATGMCQGSPLRAEIEAHGPTALEQATRAATKALSPVDQTLQPMSALFVTAVK